jgi:hypothetical protein
MKSSENKELLLYQQSAESCMNVCCVVGRE